MHKEEMEQTKVIIIQTENYLLVAESLKIEPGIKVYNSKLGIGEIQEVFGEICYVSKRESGGQIITPYKRNLGEDCKKIIAHLPLNESPFLEGVDLLPPLNEEDDLEKLAEEWVFDKNGHRWSNNNNEAGDNYGSFKEGYNKSREKYRFSEEDMRKAIEMSREGQEYDEGFVGYYWSEREIIEYLSQTRMPIGFVCEMEEVFYPANMPKDGEERPPYRIKTTLTPGGRIQWVGKYIYSY